MWFYLKIEINAVNYVHCKQKAKAQEYTNDEYQ